MTRTTWLRLVLGLVAVAAAAVAAAELASQGGGPPAPVAASRHAVESIFEDDQLLVYPPLTPAGTAEVQHTLETIRALGADRIRVVVVWRDVAPDATSSTPPPRFDAGDPSAYPPASWLAYDRVVRLARLDGLSVLFTVTAPGPLWANAAGAPDAKTATHFEPDAAAFARFVTALGRRYSGRFVAPGEPGGALPRVDEWSIWNEPNQPGWLAPQWSGSGSGAQPVSPRLYRGLVDAAYGALSATGHGPSTDTILIGELAPEGSEAPAAEAPMTPMPFVRALYCVDDGYRPLRGSAARSAGCPSAGSPGAFAVAHPGLFRISGLAHHPYSFLTAPDVPLPDPNTVPLSELGRLEHGLDAIFAAYGVHRRLLLYLTEYGYETNPPNPYRGVSFARQSLYLDEAEYLAAEDPRVRAMAQFELQDSAPDVAFPRGSFGYWSTFQTGLELLGGAQKPAFDAYRLPIYLPVTTTRPGGSLLVWGMLRPAANGTRQSAEVQWREPGGGYRTLATVTTENPSGFLQVRVRPPASGELRLRWAPAAAPPLESREVAVSVGG